MPATVVARGDGQLAWVKAERKNARYVAGNTLRLYFYHSDKLISMRPSSQFSPAILAVRALLVEHFKCFAIFLSLSP